MIGLVLRAQAVQQYQRLGSNLTVHTRGAVPGVWLMAQAAPTTSAFKVSVEERGCGLFSSPDGS